MGRGSSLSSPSDDCGAFAFARRSHSRRRAVPVARRYDHGAADSCRDPGVFRNRAVAGRHRPDRSGGSRHRCRSHPMSELHAIAKFSIPGSPDWVAIGDSVWISNNPKNNISQLDPKTNQVGAVITVAKTPCSGLAIAFGSVWVPICSDGSVQRVDPSRKRLSRPFLRASRTPKAESRPGQAASGCHPTPRACFRGSIRRPTRWFPRFPSRTGSFTAAFDAGSVWITSTKNNLLTRVDAKTEKVIAKIPVGPRRDSWPLGWAASGLSIRATAASRASIPPPTRYPRPLKSACPAPAAISRWEKERFG
jgi:YVTN family beta-propeller protein